MHPKYVITVGSGTEQSVTMQFLYLMLKFDLDSTDEASQNVTLKRFSLWSSRQEGTCSKSPVVALYQSLTHVEYTLGNVQTQI